MEHSFFQHVREGRRTPPTQPCLKNLQANKVKPGLYKTRTQIGKALGPTLAFRDVLRCFPSAESKQAQQSSPAPWSSAPHSCSLAFSSGIVTRTATFFRSAFWLNFRGCIAMVELGRRWVDTWVIAQGSYSIFTPCEETNAFNSTAVCTS